MVAFFWSRTRLVMVQYGLPVANVLRSTSGGTWRMEHCPKKVPFVSQSADLLKELAMALKSSLLPENILEICIRGSIIFMLEKSIVSVVPNDDTVQVRVFWRRHQASALGKA